MRYPVRKVLLRYLRFQLKARGVVTGHSLHLKTALHLTLIGAAGHHSRENYRDVSCRFPSASQKSAFAFPRRTALLPLSASSFRRPGARSCQQGDFWQLPKADVSDLSREAPGM